MVMIQLEQEGSTSAERVRVGRRERQSRGALQLAEILRTAVPPRRRREDGRALSRGAVKFNPITAFFMLRISFWTKMAVNLGGHSYYRDGEVPQMTTSPQSTSPRIWEDLAPGTGPQYRSLLMPES